MPTTLAARRKHRRPKTSGTKITKRSTKSRSSHSKSRTKRRTRHSSRVKHGGAASKRRRTKRKTSSKSAAKSTKRTKIGGAATVSAAKVRAQAKRLKIPLSFVNKAGVRKKKSIARLQAAINYRGHH